MGELGPDVIGEKAVENIIKSLQVLRKSNEKQIAEAAEAAIARLEKKPKP